MTGSAPDHVRPQEVPVPSQSPRRLLAYLGESTLEAAEARALQLRDRLQARAVWNVNSTARGGGVAEMLQALLPYARGMGVDIRWMVIGGSEAFFRITKRLHHALHGSAGDGSPLDAGAREVYESVLRENADGLLTAVRPGDIVILHDPQTAGLIAPLRNHGAHVVWRCHIGADRKDGPQLDAGWGFLSPYLEQAEATVFSRAAYVPDCCDSGRAVIIPPSIDPFSPKNQELAPETARAILAHAGIVADHPEAPPLFTRFDGSPGRVDHFADVTRLGPPPSWDTPLIVQVSRWDPLKDPVGVINGFVEYLHSGEASGAHLVLAGPTVRAIPDDPESAQTLDDVEMHWRELPHAARARIHLTCLPMADIEENGAIVNALQRHAAVVVQKSTQEGFGLTVTEAMWKGRPTVASAVGGIVDQIEDGVSGLLLSDPRDPRLFAAALQRVMGDPDFARSLGENARERVRERYLPIRHLLDYARLLDRLDL